MIKMFRLLPEEIRNIFWQEKKLVVAAKSEPCLTIPLPKEGAPLSLEMMQKSLIFNPR
jgi:hypothetical protein